MQNYNDQNDKKNTFPCEASSSLFWLIYVCRISMLNFSKYGERQILEWNLSQKFMNGKYFQKLHIKTVILI